MNLKMEFEEITNYIINGGFLILKMNIVSLPPIELSGMMMYFGF